MNKINSRGRDRLIMLQPAAVRPKKLELERACFVGFIILGLGLPLGSRKTNQPVESFHY